MIDDKNQPNATCQEEVVPGSPESDVKQALIVRKDSLAKEIKSLSDAIAQTQAEYVTNIERLQTKKKTIEDALHHVVALLRFEGYVSNANPSDNLDKTNDIEPKSLTDAAYSLLTEIHAPLHYKEITLKLQEKAIHIPGKDSAATLLSRINRDGRFKRTKRRGVYALSTWRVREGKRKKTSKSKRRNKLAR
jgi:hypothetical protein